MRIGIFTDTHFPEINGVAHYAERLRREYEKRGHVVYLFAPNQGLSYEKLEGGKLWRVPSFRFYGDGRSRVALPFYPPDEMRSIELDIIHTQTPAGLGVLGVAWAKLRKIPSVHTYHTLFEEYAHYLKLPESATKPVIRRILKSVIRRHDAVTVPSTAVRKLLAAQGIDVSIEILPSGIDRAEIESIASKADPESVARRFGLESCPFVITTSRLDREKNIEFLFDALSRARESVPNLKLCVVGKGTAREYLENEARKRGLGQSVVFAGFLPYEDVFALYKKALAFVFASRTETQGYVVVESFALGLPVIAVDAMGTRDMLEGDVGGYLVSPGDAEDFSRKMILLAADADLRKRKGEEASARADDLSLSRMIDRLLALYDGLLGKRRA